MRIEFGTIGNGTNVEVMLIDEKEPGWGIVDRFYTAAHGFDLQIDAPLDREWFFGLEDVLPKPIIGGQFADFHPYWG